MLEITGNIWDFHNKGFWITITTNGNVNIKGEAIMGKGIALEAKRRYPEIPILLGKKISNIGNCLHYWGEKGLLFLPTKYNWWENSDIALIEKSCRELRDFFDKVITEYPTPIYVVRLGCENGKLDWQNVKPILEKYLDDRFIVVSRL
jgi:hypothetical protein